MYNGTKGEQAGHRNQAYQPGRCIVPRQTKNLGQHRTEGWRVNMDIIKVAATSRSTAVAGAIAGVIREHKHAEVQAIGAGAVNQAVKAAAIATGYLKLDGIDIVCIPMMTEIMIDNQERTAVKLVVEVMEPK